MCVVASPLTVVVRSQLYMAAAGGDPPTVLVEPASVTVHLSENPCEVGHSEALRYGPPRMGFR